MSSRLLNHPAAFALIVSLMTLPLAGADAGPPTYDYDPDAPGVQGPTSPLFANPISRFMRTLSLAVPVLVPTAELQSALPPGFIAVSTADPNVASINVTSSYHVVDGLPRYVGPYHTVVVVAAARNTNVSPQRIEVLVIDTLRSTQESVDDANETFGGGTRLAEFEWEISEKGGVLDVRLNVEAEGHALQIAATGSANLSEHVVLNPNPSPFRIVDAGVALQAFFQASQFDRRVVPNTGTNVTATATDGRVEILGGASLRILGVGSAATFSSRQEIWLAFE
jgi:hypothetical protein